MTGKISFWVVGVVPTTLLLFVNTLLIKGVLKYMAEAIISRRGGNGGIGFKEVLNTVIITINNNWKVPSTISNKNIFVRIFGGGADGNARRGGGSGYMNNGIISVNAGQVIPITIGQNGTYAGTTSFGTYLSANGGFAASGGSGGGTWDDNGGIGYQFGGGGSNTAFGGNGGTWGGGGASGDRGIYGTFNKSGDGGEYGGGGGYMITYDTDDSNPSADIFSFGSGGNGGNYGGGGGAAQIWFAGSLYGTGDIGIGGTYGGNGGVGNRSNALNGTNTSTWTNVFNDGNGYFRGRGRSGNRGSGYYRRTTYDQYLNVYAGGGGGGYGGNGGNGVVIGNSFPSVAMADAGTGGGGGYGSNGGRNAGGGGGYGGDGGSNYGGGGGYGKGAIGGNDAGGGGGYYSKGGNNTGGGGGYGNGGDMGEDGGYGAGGGARSGNGGNGICIIQFYEYELNLS